MKHHLQSKSYVRYGDDFILIENDVEKWKQCKTATTDFLEDILKLQIHNKNDKLMKVRQRLALLGVRFWSSGRQLNKRNISRIKEKLDLHNTSSYRGLALQHGSLRQKTCFGWMVVEKINNVK